MVRARITTAAATTATEIQKMGARRTRCMMVVLVLRVGNPGGSPFHPSIRAPSEIGSRSGLPVCMGRHADRRNRGAPPRLMLLGVVQPVVVGEPPVHLSCDITLEAADRFGLGLALGTAALEVATCVGVIGETGDDDPPQRRVGLTVPGA